MLRGLWIFHAESGVRLLTSRRFPTVERKMQRLLGPDYIELPSDEDLNMMFISEVLHEQEDHHIPPWVPEAFHEDFKQGSFAWNPEEESRAEKLWPLGPISSICRGRIWPLLFLFKKGFYLVTVVALERGRLVPPQQGGPTGASATSGAEAVRALELPQITAAFSVLEDVCDFIPPSLTFSDVAGISELQYYIRTALPFGSPVNTNYTLLKTVRHGFPNKEDETVQRSPAWKPYLYKGKSKLTLSIVETVSCTLYGKAQYEDECFIAGTVYCCADIMGVPEICVPIGFHNDKGLLPEISVHNCAQVVGGIRAAKEESFKISCAPPTGPFVLCKYRYASSPIVPVTGHYQIKEMSPMEFRLLLQIQFHPVVGSSYWSCHVRLPLHHRGVIKSHDLKCTAGCFSLTEHGQCILWNLNVRRPRSNLEANLLGDLIFEANPGSGSRPAAEFRNVGLPSTRPTPAGAASSGIVGGGHPPARSINNMGSAAHFDSPSTGNSAGMPQLGVGGAVVVSRGSAVIIGSALSPSGGLMDARASGMTTTLRQEAAVDPSYAGADNNKYDASQLEWAASEHGEQRGTDVSGSGDAGERGTTGDGVPAPGGGKPAVPVNVAREDRTTTRDNPLQEDRQEKTGTTSQLDYMQDPFLLGMNCYAEVNLEIPDTTLSGVRIDPKAITVYPTTRVHSGANVQREVRTGRYAIWNTFGEVRGHHIGFEFDTVGSLTALLRPPANGMAHDEATVQSQNIPDA